MKYNWTKCKLNITENGLLFNEDDNTISFYDNNITLQNETKAYKDCKLIIDRDEYKVGDLVLSTRSLSILIVTNVFDDGLEIAGSNSLDDIGLYTSCSYLNRNYPIIELSDLQLDEWLSSRHFGGELYNPLKQIMETRYNKQIQGIICKECGELITTNHYYWTNDRQVICKDCMQKYYRQCNRCGDFFRKDTITDNDTLCQKCRKRDYVLPYHQFAPPLVFCGGKDDGSNLFLGLEMEVDGGGESNRNVKEIMQLVNPKDKQFLYCMHDGSLDDGLEIITQPATLEYHTSFKGQYTRLFGYLLSKGYLAHDTSTCGIHIHFNRSFYKDNEELYISRLLYLVDKFWGEIVKFSRRNQRRIDRYTKKLDRPISTYIHQSNKSGNHDYHYYAINLANKNTIEFRMFKGSLNIETLMATLQFVNNCVLCAKTKSAEEIQSMTFEDLIIGKSCRNYWEKHKNSINTEE